MKKKKYFILAAVLVVVLIAAWQLFFKQASENDILIKPSYGKFIQTVSSTGELQAKNSIEIMGPSNARTVNIWQMKITRLVDEGTQVKTGDFVAELDKTEIMGKIKDVELNIEKFESQYLQTQLDSTLSLSAARDEIENMKYSLEEKILLKEQSKYEPPATIRQVEIDYDKVERALSQAKKNYETKVKQAKAKISEVGTDLSKERQKYSSLVEILQEFTILAPSDGMVIYAREWNGSRRVVGSTVSTWDPVIATLPDLSSMQSITYINEVDIQKVKLEQKVIVKLDAAPNKFLTGTVTRVANIGEQRKNSDSKVFEVLIQINEKDTTLLPSMTTSNEITIAALENAIYIPIECIHSEEAKGKKLNFVFKKNGKETVKQQVELGIMNENYAVIKRGVGRDDFIYLNTPDNPEKINVSYLAN